MDPWEIGRIEGLLRCRNSISGGTEVVGEADALVAEQDREHRHWRLEQVRCFRRSGVVLTSENPENDWNAREESLAERCGNRETGILGTR